MRWRYDNHTSVEARVLAQVLLGGEEFVADGALPLFRFVRAHVLLQVLFLFERLVAHGAAERPLGLALAAAGVAEFRVPVRRRLVRRVRTRILGSAGKSPDHYFRLSIHFILPFG